MADHDDDKGHSHGHGHAEAEAAGEDHHHGHGHGDDGECLGGGDHDGAHEHGHGHGGPAPIAERKADAEGYVDITEEGDGGLCKKILVEGRGEATPRPESQVSVHYTGTLHSDGSKFDSSRDRDQKFDFKVGVGQVIKGWDVGICSMKKGEKCILRCSADYGYGERGSPPKIPGGATLNFEVELFSWKEQKRTPAQMSAAERSAHALKMKQEGTAAFKAKNYEDAAEAYAEGADYITYVAGGGHAHGHSHGGAECHADHGGDGEGASPLAELGSDDKALAIALLNNSAAARLKTNDAELAAQDCTKALGLDDKNIKALFRRGQAQLALRNYADCVKDAAAVIAMDPSNKQAAQLQRKAAAAKKKEKDREKKMCSKMFG